MIPALFLLILSIRHVQQKKQANKKLFLLARRCISVPWIEPRPPAVTQSRGETFKVSPMERLSKVLNGNEALS